MQIQSNKKLKILEHASGNLSNAPSNIPPERPYYMGPEFFMIVVFGSYLIIPIVTCTIIYFYHSSSSSSSSSSSPSPVTDSSFSPVTDSSSIMDSSPDGVQQGGFFQIGE